MPRLPINIASVSTADNNVKARVRMLQNIEDQYFDDPAIDKGLIPTNRLAT
jgi:hypothetical protein